MDPAVACYLAGMIINPVIASMKKRRAWVWFLVSFLTGPFALIFTFVLIVLPRVIPMAVGSLIQSLGGRGEKIFKENLVDEMEKTIVKLKGSFGEGLIITDKRFYVLKWGFMAGNTFGGRCNVFEFASITGVEIKKNWLTGTFEVLTPATQNSQKSYWGNGASSAIKSDNIVTFQQNKFNYFQGAVNLGRELISKFHRPSNPILKGDYSELEKLAELKEKGIINQNEFEAKKKLILGLS